DGYCDVMRRGICRRAVPGPLTAPGRRGRAEAEDRAGRRAEEGGSGSGPVLPEAPRRHLVALRPHLVMQLGVDEVNLAQIRLARIVPHPAPGLARPAPL